MLSISKRRSASNRTGPTRLDISYLDAPDLHEQSLGPADAARSGDPRPAEERRR